MRIGVVLPTFAEHADDAFRAAEQAEAAGLHGCFCYDHLWPLGEPGRPAIAPFPVLGALAQRTERLVLGTLVARIGLVADDLLYGELLTVAELTGGRLIAGLGTGDHLSRPELDAYGLAMERARVRRRRVGQLARRLLAAGVPTWVGGRSPNTVQTARSAGALPNLWAAPPSEVAAVGAGGPVTWGGSLPDDPERAARRLGALAGAGAEWAVVGWPGSAAPVVRAARAAGIELADR